MLFYWEPFYLTTGAAYEFTLLSRSFALQIKLQTMIFLFTSQIQKIKWNQNECRGNVCSLGSFSVCKSVVLRQAIPKISSSTLVSPNLEHNRIELKIEISLPVAFISTTLILWSTQPKPHLACGPKRCPKYAKNRFCKISETNIIWIKKCNWVNHQTIHYLCNAIFTAFFFVNIGI